MKNITEEIERLEVEPSVKCFLDLVLSEKEFDPLVKDLAEATSQEFRDKNEFVHVLAGGNLKFPEDVLEEANRKIRQQFPTLFD